MRGQFVDEYPLATEIDGLAGRAGACQRLELADAEIALVHGGDEFGADRAGYADNGYNGIVRHILLLQAIKKPRSLSGGASVQIDAIVRLRAHGSRAPGGGFGFGVALCGGVRGAVLCGRLSPPSTAFGLKMHLGFRFDAFSSCEPAPLRSKTL